MASAVETRGLTKIFPKQPGWRSLLQRGGEKTALNSVDLRVEKGEIFGLLGPNGAGKTTLIKILSTLILPTAGEAYVGDREVVRDSTAVRRLVGVVYGDERTFFWRLSVLENLRFYSALYRIPKRTAEQRIAHLLDLVDLTEAANLRMHYYSSGMKQRAAIARGLLADPAILYMDEPTRSVDPIGSFELRKLIRERIVQDDCRTVLLATNIMDEAESLCDRLALLDRGEIKHQGTVSQLRQMLHQEVLHRIVMTGTDPDVLLQLERIPGVRSIHLGANEYGDQVLELVAERASEAVPTAIRLIVDADGSVWSSTPQEPSLDDIFRITFRRNGAALADETTEVVGAS